MKEQQNASRLLNIKRIVCIGGGIALVLVVWLMLVLAGGSSGELCRVFRGEHPTAARAMRPCPVGRSLLGMDACQCGRLKTRRLEHLQASPHTCAGPSGAHAPCIRVPPLPLSLGRPPLPHTQELAWSPPLPRPPPPQAAPQRPSSPPRHPPRPGPSCRPPYLPQTLPPPNPPPSPPKGLQQRQ